MRCKKEEFVEGAIFHIYNHSTAKSNLFDTHNDYLYFLNKLKKNINDDICEIYAYCLMPNHFHFCIKQNSDFPIYKIFNKLCTSYAMYYNRKHHRKGRLFASKLQHIKILDDRYLISLCRYIHYNPVKAGIVNNINDWKYSNYLEYVKKRDGVLFSKELLERLPDIFDNYEETIRVYEKHLNDKEFLELMF